MGGFLGEKWCGHFSITKHQYPKKQLQWIVWGLWPSCTDQLFFFNFLLFWYIKYENVMLSEHLCIYFTCSDLWWQKNGCSFDVTYLWAHDPNTFFLDFVMLFE